MEMDFVRMRVPVPRPGRRRPPPPPQPQPGRPFPDDQGGQNGQGGPFGGRFGQGR